MSELTRKILQLDEVLFQMSKEAQTTKESVEKEARQEAEALMQEYKKRCDEIREQSESDRISEEERAGRTSGTDNVKFLRESEREALAREIFLQIRKSLCPSSA